MLVCTPPLKTLMFFSDKCPLSRETNVCTTNARPRGKQSLRFLGIKGQALLRMSNLQFTHILQLILSHINVATMYLYTCKFQTAEQRRNNKGRDAARVCQPLHSPYTQHSCLLIALMLILNSGPLLEENA